MRRSVLRSRREPTDEWWVRLAHEVQHHVREEVHFLDAYRDTLERIDDPGSRRLLEWILRDERLHHQVFEEMQHALLHEDGSPLPEMPSPSPEVAASLVPVTERFVDAERDDRRRLRELARELESRGHDSMWPVVVRLMEHDTAKHVLILEYLLARFRDAAAAAPRWSASTEQ